MFPRSTVEISNILRHCGSLTHWGRLKNFTITLHASCDSSQINAQPLLNLLQRNPFSLRDHRFYPQKLQAHHPGKEGEHVSRMKRRNHFGEECGKQSGEDPVRETAKRLAFGAMTVGKYLRDKNPDDCALANGMCRNKGNNAGRNDGVTLRKKCPRDQPKRQNVAERTYV